MHDRYIGEWVRIISDCLGNKVVQDHMSTDVQGLQLLQTMALLAA